jgi:hypothetical protein
MARFGTGINASLGAINYTPYMQGALAGSQSIAQGIAALGQAAGGAINTYYAKKEEDKKKEEAANSFIKTVEANPSAFQGYLKDGKVDKEAIRTMVDTLGVPGTLQLNTYLAEAAKQQKAEKTKSDAAKFATQLEQGGGNLPSPYRKGAETSMYSPESIQAGRGAYMEQEKTKAEIEALRSRASQFGDPSTAMKDAKVIADAELASGKITPAQYQQRFADLVSMGGREVFQPGGIFRRADGKGDPVSTVVNAKGEFFTQDVSGKRVPLNLGEYSPASRSESNFLSPESFQKLSTEMVNKQNQIESINDFLKSTEGLSRGGLERKFNSCSSKAKNLLGAPLNEQEQALGQSRAMQQRLLGAIKNEVLGPGVLTDQDAERLFAAMGGDVENLFTNIDRVRETLQQIMNEKYNLYKQDLDFYNYNAGEKYTFAKTLKPVTLYTPPQSTGSGQSPISTPNRVFQLGTNSLTPVNRGGSVNLMDFIKKP